MGSIRFGIFGSRSFGYVLRPCLEISAENLRFCSLHLLTPLHTPLNLALLHLAPSRAFQKEP